MSDNRFNHSRAGFLVWLLVFIMASAVPAEAQKYFFDNYSVKQGLSEQKVYTIFQDSKDYIWLGTANGVSRFDGREFDNFTSRNGLATGGVKCIRQDSKGDIWFGHLNGGISRFNGQKFEQAVFDSITFTGDVTSIAAKDSSLWFTSISDGAILAEFPVKDVKHIRAKQFRGKDGLSDQVSGSILNRAGEFICIADVGMRRYNPAEKKFENYRMPHMTTYFSTICILNDSKGNIWFGTYNGGLYKYILSESRMEFFDLPKLGVKSNTVNCLAEDSRGRIWIGTWGGGIAVTEGDSLRRFNESNGLKASKIYDILEDIEGNILIADQTNGLTIYKGDAFVTINEKEILPDPNVNAITEDETGATWFGTNAGVVRFWSGTNKKPVVYNQEKSSISNEIKFFRKDRDGNIWLGTNGEGVVLFNVKKERFESQPYINSTLYRDGIVTAMEIDKQNHLWVGTLEGVAVGTIGENNFQRYTLLDSLTVSRITALYCDPKGNMWVGTEPKPGKPGLIRYDPVKQHFYPVASLQGVFPKSFIMDRRDILWIGTGEGLIAFRNDSVLFTVTQADGLLSNNINLLADAGDGSIYIGTNNGLNRYFPDTKRIYSYTERNGFTGIETRQNAVYKTASGDLWFGTANGASQLRQSRLYTKGLDPLTHIMGMQVNYETRNMIAGMKLNFKERSILFDYYSICLTNPDVVRYKVKLDGADNDWRPVTDQTRAIYSALSPGKYTFNVIARNSEGLWNKNPVRFHFIIKPPFYQTWWFILLTIFVIVVLVITYIQIREQNLIKEKIILEEKVRERTAEVVQKSQIIEEKNRDITASIRYAERIQRAMLPNIESYQETFVLYLPKDIVSGDFYWMYDNGDYLFLAAVDCTGHGVPGAFMSIIGHNSLNKVVREYGLIRPAAILDQLNIEVNKAILLSQEKGINDGMDLTLIVHNRKNSTIELAGAYNPLYQVRNGEVIVHKTDRFAIGMATLEQKKTFSNISVDIKPGDMLYMCSDGYADQFGSPEIKKFKTVNIKKVLGEIWNLPVQEQKVRLEKEIMDWKGELAQVDDIMFIGTRIPG
ncbi:MAG: two-component regulator propeller domain-containing protein [Bacteroidales bacterium]|jgi:ligand-binding sensor domain-containing protein/serine phosphatase RsbU (regulator of sigma subunit)